MSIFFLAFAKILRASRKSTPSLMVHYGILCGKWNFTIGDLTPATLIKTAYGVLCEKNPCRETRSKVGYTKSGSKKLRRSARKVGVVIDLGGLATARRFF